MPTHHVRPIRRGLAVITLLAVSGCGTRVGGRFGGESNVSSTTNSTAATPSTTLDPAATKAQITANWEKFFSHTSTLAERQALLENGANYAEALAQRAQDPLQAQATATVKDVQLTDADHASVTYDVLLNGQVALSNAAGTAVLQDGTWKVSAQSFCSLVTLGATKPIPGCS